MPFQLRRMSVVGDTVSINGQIRHIAMKIICAFNTNGQREYFGPYLAGDEYYMNDIIRIRNEYENCFTLNYEGTDCSTVNGSGDGTVLMGFNYINKSPIYNKEPVLPLEN